MVVRRYPVGLDVTELLGWSKEIMRMSIDGDWKNVRLLLFFL